MSDHPSVFATFIVRLTRDEEGTVQGIVERASTGAKRPVDDFTNVGLVIAAMLNTEREERKS